MMKLTTPTNGNNNLFYVTSETHGDRKHIVVRHGPLFFCDCADFFVRRLPKLGRSSFSFCKHGEFVRDVVGSLPADVSLIQAVRNGPK